MSGEKDGSIDIYLRTQHAEYLSNLAEREEISISRAFALVVEKYAEIVAISYRSPRKVAKHLAPGRKHLQMLDERAAQAGLGRSDLSRRLIDAAIIDAAIEAETA